MILLEGLLSTVKAVAHQAGQAILDYYQQDHIAVTLKPDKTPVTKADLVAHDVIVQGLSKLTPNYPILSEESADIAFQQRQQWQRYWLVDPLDGTKEFIEKTDEFSVNIALVEVGKPIMGVIYAPVEKNLYWAVQGQGAFKQMTGQSVTSMVTRRFQSGKMVATVSRRHGRRKIAQLMRQLGGGEFAIRGSALKFALVAEGKADVYLRFGPSSEWDSAAGQCILEEAGGKVMDLSGRTLRYNSQASLSNPVFLAVGDRQYAWLQHLQKLDYIA